MEDLAHQQEDIVSKYKRLLSMARASLETNQKTIAEKDYQIGQLKNALDRMEREKSISIMSNSSSLKVQEDGSLIPRQLIRRVDVNGTIWVLIQYDNHMDAWVSFASEQDLDDFIQRLPGSSLTKPHKCYTPTESTELEAEAKMKIDRVVEEFRRYKVKSEIARKQTTEETKMRHAAGASVLKSTDDSSSDPVADVHKYKDENQRLLAQAVATEAKWKLAYEKVVRENESLRHSGGEALLAAQWRERYEVTSKEKYELLEKLKIYEKSSSGGVNGKTLEEAYNELKDNHRDLQRRMNAIEKRRIDENHIVEGRSMTPNRLDSSKLEYVKQMIYKYLICRDEEVKAHMERAIEAIFRYNDKERTAIEERRRIASLDTLSTITSFLTSSSSK